MTGASRSQPRTEMVAVPSANSPPDVGRQAQPAGGQDAEQVTVSEEQDVAVGCPDPGDHAVGPGGDLVDGLAARPRSAPDRPVGELAPDVGRSDVPRGRRSPTRGDRGRGRRPRRNRPVRRSPRHATADWSAPVRRRDRRAVRRAPGPGPRPAAVNGTSVRLVCRPSLAHSVSPCRTSQTSWRRWCRVAGRVAHQADRRSVSGRTVSAGSAAKNWRGRQPKSGARKAPGTCEMRVL